MAIIASPLLATSVSCAGGLGFIGTGAETRDCITNLQEASSLLRSAREASSSLENTFKMTNALPVGIGFLLWKDDINVAVAAIEKFNPCAVWLYAPYQTQEFNHWSKRIREVSPRTEIWIQIGTVREAKTLLHSCQLPDVVIVQGSESGGHGRVQDGMGLMTLFPEIADVMKESNIPLLAAGGIADGRGAAAAMCLGASGIVMGTRFIASSEARVDKGYQDELVRTTDGAASTTRTLLYNHLQGFFDWPKEYSPRVVINKSFTDHQAGKDFIELKILYEESSKLENGGWGPDGRRAIYCGASVGLIRDVKPSSNIISEVQQQVLVKLSSELAK